MNIDFVKIVSESTVAKMVFFISALITIIGIPVLYQQLKTVLTKPELEFVLVSPLDYIVRNKSKQRTAEEVLISFGLFETDKFQLDSKINQPIPILSQSLRSINPASHIGRSRIFPSGMDIEKYFGLVYLSGKYAETNIYFVYADNKNKGETFYTKVRRELIGENGIELAPAEIIKGNNNYLNIVFPVKERIYLKDIND